MTDELVKLLKMAHKEYNHETDKDLAEYSADYVLKNITKCSDCEYCITFNPKRDSTVNYRYCCLGKMWVRRDTFCSCAKRRSDTK